MFPYYTAQNFLFAEVFRKLVSVEDSPYFIFPVLIPILIWLISKRIFKKPYSLLPPLIYIASPWGWYLALAHSSYIFLFFMTLSIIYGVILVRIEESLYGNIFIIIAGTTLMYCSSIFLMFIPMMFIILVIFKIISFKQIKTAVVFLALLTFPLFIMMNKIDFGQESKIFSDPTLLNSINRYQGAANQIGLRNFARISENKYLFFSEYVLYKYLTQLMPDVFFTPQYRLLGFSFSPPIFLGFAIPFVYGLYLTLKDSKLRNALFVSSFLVIPSVLSNNPVALNRLVIFSPVIFLVITYGLISLYKIKQKVVARNLLIITAILLIFQLIVTINDIRIREGQRYIQYFGRNYKITEP